MPLSSDNIAVKTLFICKRTKCDRRKKITIKVVLTFLRFTVIFIAVIKSELQIPYKKRVKSITEISETETIFLRNVAFSSLTL